MTRARPAESGLGVVLVLEWLVAIVATFGVAVELGWWALLGIVPIVALPLAARASLGWGNDPPAVGAAALGAAAGLHLILAGVLIADFVRVVADVGGTGLDAFHVTVDLLPAALALAIAAACLSQAGAARGAAVACLSLAGLGVLLALGGGVARATGADCGAFSFDRGRWSSPSATDGGVLFKSTRQRMARMIRSCGTLDGVSRVKVERLLGKPDLEGGSWTLEESGTFSAGEALDVRYDRSGRVTSLSLERTNPD